METRSKGFRFLWVMFIGIAVSLAMSGHQQAFAEDEGHENNGALLSALQQSKVSLADGISQASKGTEVPVSAKFELDDKGKLSLSIYTAEKGLAVAPQSNVFMELSGSPELVKWSPESESIKGGEDLAQAKEQLAILSKGKVSLLDIVMNAKKDYQGTVFAAIPEVKGNKSVCEVRIDKDGQVSEHDYDVVTGSEVKTGNTPSKTILDFDQTALGQLPDSWVAGVTGGGAPKWSVEADATAPSQPNVLKQSGSGTYPWCVKKDVSLKDGYVEVKFKPVAGSEDQAGGIVWRWQDGDNYYITRANALEDNVTIYHTVNGRRRSFKSVDMKVTSNQWHTLRVDFAGNQFKVTFDGKVAIEATNDTFKAAGAVGVWTKADSVTLFDDFGFGGN